MEKLVLIFTVASFLTTLIAVIEIFCLKDAVRSLKFRYDLFEASVSEKPKKRKTYRQGRPRKNKEETTKKEYKHRGRPRKEDKR